MKNEKSHEQIHPKLLFFYYNLFYFRKKLFIQFFIKQKFPIFQLARVLTMNGCVRVKTCDLEWPQISQAASQSAAIVTTQQNNSNTTDDNGRAVDNQYSFV